MQDNQITLMHGACMPISKCNHYIFKGVFMNNSGKFSGNNGQKDNTQKPHEKDIKNNPSTNGTKKPENGHSKDPRASNNPKHESNSGSSRPTQSGNSDSKSNGSKAPENRDNKPKPSNYK